MDTKTVITDINTALDIAMKVASAVSIVAPGATVAGVALSKIVSVAEAAAQGSSDAADYIGRMQALAASTADPSPADWAALDAQTDADVQKLEESTA
ncbi:MAG: hypothetical protein WDN03_00390 [Rhizomicrobium sp.]